STARWNAVRPPTPSAAFASRQAHPRQLVVLSSALVVDDKVQGGVDVQVQVKVNVNLPALALVRVAGDDADRLDEVLRAVGLVCLGATRRELPLVEQGRGLDARAELAERRGDATRAAVALDRVARCEPRREVATVEHIADLKRQVRLDRA